MSVKYGVYISGKAFINDILSGVKTIETRNRHTLDRLIGEHVAIIGKNRICYGYADIVSVEECASLEEYVFHAHEHRVSEGSPYYWSGSKKIFYKLANAERCEPKQIKSVIAWNRSYLTYD